MSLKQIQESRWTYLVIFTTVGWIAAYGYRNWLPKKAE